MLNFSQWAISFTPQLGVYNTVRGGMDLLSPTRRHALKKEGLVDAYDKNAMLAVLGSLPGGAWGKFAQKMTKYSGFNFINRMNLYWAGATYMRAVKQWIPQARKSGKLAELRRKQLKDFGIDYRKDYTDTQRAEGMHTFATNSQLQKNILKEPLFFNEEALRPFVLFKRFGLRQFLWIKDMLSKELQRGNVMPAVRLAAAGSVAGAVVIGTINAIKSGLSGEPVYRKEDSVWDSIVQSLAIIGSFGVVSDMVEIEKLSQLGNRIKFQAYPVMLSDVERIMETYTAVMRDAENYGSGWIATKRNAYRMFGLTGTYPRAAAERLKTPGQKQRRLQYKKGREKREIFDLILNAKERAAKKRIANWNTHYPNEPFKVNEFSLRQIIRYLKRQMVRDIEVEAARGTPEYKQKYKEEMVQFKRDIQRLKEKFNSR